MPWLTRLQPQQLTTFSFWMISLLSSLAFVEVLWKIVAAAARLLSSWSLGAAREDKRGFEKAKKAERNGEDGAVDDWILILWLVSA